MKDRGNKLVWRRQRGEEKGEEMEIWREVGGHYFDRAGADRRVCSIIRPE